MIDAEGKEHDDRDGRYTGDGTASGGAAPEKAGKGTPEPDNDTPEKKIVSRLKSTVTRALSDKNWQEKQLLSEGQDADPSGKLSHAFGFPLTKIFLIPDDIRKTEKHHGKGNEKYKDQIGLRRCRL